MENVLAILVIGCLLVSCESKHENRASPLIDKAAMFYGKAQLKAKKGKVDSALILLEQAFNEGLESPMQVVVDSDLQILIDDPETRSDLRSLLKEYARENECQMAGNDEAGERIWLMGKVLDENTGEPLSGVSVELVHADNEGLYFAENSTFNPRLFAYLKTNERGGFIIHTIKPGRYKDDDGNDVPSHVHFTLDKEGYRSYGSEFTFSDDPVFRANGNIDEVPVAEVKHLDGKKQYAVRIELQAE